jgi:hypothetical protein
MHNQAKQSNIPAELADNLIGSLDDLTAIEGDELRCQVVMLIDHSYALGYVAGASGGLVARMRCYCGACANHSCSSAWLLMPRRW